MSSARGLAVRDKPVGSNIAHLGGSHSGRPSLVHNFVSQGIRHGHYAQSGLFEPGVAVHCKFQYITALQTVNDRSHLMPFALRSNIDVLRKKTSPPDNIGPSSSGSRSNSATLHRLMSS